MSNNLSFIPGRYQNIRKIHKYYIYRNNVACNCIQNKITTLNTSTNNKSETENERISQIISNNLGGKITYGNFGIPAKINYLGRIEGQSGGSSSKLTNKF